MRMLVFAAALALATAAIAAPLPPLTPEGLGPVRIGMTVPQAEAALGAKLKIGWSDGPGSCGMGVRAATADEVAYMFENRHLVRIDIDSPQGRHVVHSTAAGIRIGSTEADVLKAYAHVVTEGHPYDAHGHYMIVYTSGKKAGFIFETDGKRVTSFRAGIYPALGYSEGCS